MDEKKAKDTALFRYGMIAQVMHDSGKEQNLHFKEIAKKQLDVPHKDHKKSYSIGSLKEWLRKYKNGGLDALRPSCRSDRGISKKINSDLCNKIKQKIEQYPNLPSAGVYRSMTKEGSFSFGDFTENTFRNFVKTNALRQTQQNVIDRKKFESPAINMLWITDFMHCYPIADRTDHNRKKKTYLCTIIDDHSRLLTGFGFFFQENSMALMKCLKSAILQYGVCLKLYCDNGSVFSTYYLQEACARIGIALLHSKPYDSPSRGKIERFFRTVRLMFLPTLDFSKINHLDQLNQLFQEWVVNEYHEKIHGGINESPKDRYLNSLPNLTIKRISDLELDHAFYHSFKRVVKKDSTISVNGKLFEVPPEYIGSCLEFRAPLDNLKKISLFIDNLPVCQIKEVNLIENFEKPYTGIHFSKEDKQ
jgi:transposase InsO family protein